MSSPMLGPDGLLRFYCPNGHRLKINAKHAGRRARCPACGELVRAPTLPPTESMSPSAVVRLLSREDSSPRGRPADKLAEHERAAVQGQREAVGKALCPQCKELIDAHERVCHHCRLYLGGEHKARALHLIEQSRKVD